MGRSTGFSVPLDTLNGLPSIPGFPKVDGPVYAIAPDNAGGWYIGGKFNYVGGVPRRNFARVNSNGTVHSLNLAPDGPVYAIEMEPAQYSSSPYLFIGGDFSFIDGIPVYNVAQLNTMTKQIISTWVPDINGPVYALKKIGNNVYVGGSFTNVDGNNNLNLAIISISRNYTVSFNPNTTSGPVYALYYNKESNSLFVGGNFTAIGSNLRQHVGQINISTQTVSSWNPNVNGTVRAIAGLLPPLPGNTSSSGSGGKYVNEETAAVSNTIYIGGEFTNINGTPVKGFAEMSMTSNTPLPSTLTANCNGTVWAIYADKKKNRIYVGGKFSSLGGTLRNNLACLDTLGNATSWNPSAGGKVSAICRQVGISIHVGGEFPCMGSVEKAYVAEFDLGNQTFTSWNPQVYGNVLCFALSANNILYLGGTFDSIQGQARNGLGAIDLNTGLVTPFNPGCNGMVRTIFLQGNKLYAGGFFTTVAGQTRKNIACVNVTDFSVTSWNPNANGTVNALTGINEKIIAGGYFTNIGGAVRNRMAVLDTMMGYADLLWDAPANDGIYSFDLEGNLLYAGGWFTSLDGNTRNNIACVDVSSSAVTGFNPNANDFIKSVYVSGSTVCMGGDFSSVYGQPRKKIALYDLGTGSVLSFDPGADSITNAFYLSGDTLYAGGEFITIDNEVHAYFAALNTQYVASLQESLQDAGPKIYPTPTTGALNIDLPENSKYKIIVYSQLGQEAAALEAEGQNIRLDVSGFENGIYFIEITSGEKIYTQKFIKAD